MVAGTRIRVISDNDYAGDPDGLFQLVHLLLCSSVDVRAVIPSAFRPFFGHEANANRSAEAAELVREAFAVTGRSAPLALTTDEALGGGHAPIQTEAARAIVDEAMRDDARPLFVLAGGGLTSIASAWLMEPRIADRLTLIWIGGCVPAAEPDATADHVEYNTSIDVNAARVVFNDSTIPVWQVPHDTYTQVMVSWDELAETIYPVGAIGRWLEEKTHRLDPVWEHVPRGEAFVLGDSPLVLLSALHSPFDARPASSRSEISPAPSMDRDGRYSPNPDGRPIKVFRQLDTRLLMADLLAKLRLAATP